MNEVTVKIKCGIEEFYKILENKGFSVHHIFSMDDTYFIPSTLDIDKLSTREILKKAVLVREVVGKTSGKVRRIITFKIKNYDEKGNILSQKSINCDIFEIENAKELLNAMGYKEIMNIKENDIVYEKDGFEIAVKDIANGDNLLEIETDKSGSLNTVDKIIKKINDIGIPIYTDSYFVKKAEIELNKVLGR